MEADAHVAPSLPRVTSDSGREDSPDRSGPPVLEPEHDGPAERFANLVGPRNPVRVFVVGLLAGYALLVTAMVFLGLTLIHVVLPIGGLAEADADLSEWLADNRSPGQEDASWVGSTLAGGHVIPAVIGLCLAFFLITKRWLLAAFVVFAVALESATYRATSMMVDRDRPDVERLEQLPVHDSYPSGHVAASIALYGGLLLLLASRIQSSAFRVAAVLVGIAIPLFVAWSRMYRGMHYVTDASAGVLMGLAALAIIVFVARATRAASERRGEGELE
ncbi:MAG TPA: phosphatase PAP2 family protein [Gaiellaceae bacterium]|nr:phosphatase PAP2 family protein [Gaiellaceae bacterium]